VQLATNKPFGLVAINVGKYIRLFLNSIINTKAYLSIERFTPTSTKMSIISWISR
jgi:hypothetical protein